VKFPRLTATLLMVTGLALASPASAANPSLASSPQCKSSQIAVSLGRSNGAAGTIYYSIDFVNRGATCRIWGVPAIQPATKGHGPVGLPARNQSMGKMAAMHTLRRGDAVNVPFGVTETGNYPVSRCHPRYADGILVSIPGFVTTRYVALRISVCTSLSSTSTQLLLPGR
jgi:Protein of unknown function (DUF4232)